MNKPDKPSEFRRWIGIGLRTAHIASVVLLGAQLLGATGWAALGAQATLASGLLLFGSELADRRVAAFELAGLVVLAKLALVAWMAWHGPSVPLFWALVVLSSVMSHAPRPLRHWPGRG